MPVSFHGAAMGTFVAKCLALMFLLMGQAPSAHAQAVFSLEAENLRGTSLGVHVGVFEDRQASLAIADVASGEARHRFEPAGGSVVGFGFSHSAAWIRFTVDNPERQALTWMLEFAYPHVDQIELYEPVPGGGFVRRVSGDHQPFAQRDFPYRNVVFRMQQPPGTRTYYLRAHTSGSLTIPLVAWSPEALIDHMNAEQPALWMFYGLFLALSLYNLFIFLSVRERAYLYYVGYALAFAGFQFVLNGLAYQYLWPNAVWWANQCMPCLISLAFYAGVEFHRAFLGLRSQLPLFDRILGALGACALLGVVVPLFIPYATGIRFVVATSMVTIVAALTSVGILVVRGHRPAYFYAASWVVLLVGILLYLLKTLNVVPTTFMSEWSIQIGASLEILLLALGLADRINVMRGDLQHLNGRLSVNVNELEVALARAEQARRAKSEFLAGVSHELRTPLNSIINIPEGLLEDFVWVQTACCSACASEFELEPDEQAAATAPCPECGQVETLQPRKRLLYRGEPDQSVRYLNQVISSGGHLLDVVNDILDVSRLEAGRMSLTFVEVDMRALFARVLMPLTGLADRKGVTLVVETPPSECVVLGDRVKLGQVLVNLVSNAIKFSDGRGRVRVWVEVESSQLRVAVQDEGVGISVSDQARIFQSFVQAKGGGTRRFGGSGLGLAISKQLVDLHKGDIWVESELGKGSTFFVRLPIAGAGRPVDGSDGSDGSDASDADATKLDGDARELLT